MEISQGVILSQVFNAGNLDLAGVASAAGEDGEYLDRDPGKSGHQVYNFEVAEHHTYIADGFRVHNTSVLSFLNHEELAGVDVDSLADTNSDGSWDYVEVDIIRNGLAAGSTIYKQADNGSVQGFQTYTDEYGRLVQLQFVRTLDGTVQKNLIELTGAEFGERAGQLITPFLTAAILGDDATVFERLAADTIVGTFVQNILEFGGGYIHDQIVSGGLQNNSIKAIADHTFEDFWEDFASNAVENSELLLSQWIMAEVFEGLNTDTYGGKLAYLLANEGVNYIVDLSVHELAVDVLHLSEQQAASLGMGVDKVNEVFSASNMLNLVFKAAIGTVLPDLESPEAQIGSGLITLALDVFAGIGGVWGSVIGYVGGLVLDLFFDEDPEAFTDVVFNPFTGRLELGSTDTADGGSRAVAQASAEAFVDFINGLLDGAHASSTNLAELAGTMSLVFGHYEESFRNGDGHDYATIKEAVMARVVDTLGALQLNDGDVKFAAALAYVAGNGGTSTSEEVLNDFSMRVQVAADYQAYLENKGAYDALIAASPDSAFAAGWAVTFMLAREYGYAEDFNVVGTDVDGVHIGSSGNDYIDGAGGNDEIRAYGGDDTLAGGAGNDLLSGGDGDDVLNGQDGDDTIYGGAGDNTLSGGAGVDEFYLGQNNNTIDGGADEDLVTFEGVFSNYTVEDLGNNHIVVTNDETGAVTELQDVEFLRFRDMVRTYDPAYENFVLGSSGDDLLNGTALRDAINGLGGNDTIYGFDGDDFLSGDAGDDQLFGGAGNDWIFGVLGNDIIRSGSGNDNSYGGANGDYLWGESGNDVLLGEGGDDVVNGGDGADTVLGGSGDDLLEGDFGRDSISGEGGDDDLYGGAQDDTLSGGNGDDLIDGGDGSDLVEGDGGDDEIYAGNGNDSINGGNGDDLVYAGGGNDQIIGGWGDDTVYGGGGNDKIFVVGRSRPENPFVVDYGVEGHPGADYYHEWGRDVAYGEGGDDQISLGGIGSVAFGGDGNDTVYLGFSQQRFNGGTGLDTAVLQFTNFKDAVWYRSESGRVGAIIFDTTSDTPALPGLRSLQAGEDNYSMIVDVEQIFTANGSCLNQGYSFERGYGNGKYNAASYAGYVELNDADFASLFSDEQFLLRRYVSTARQWEGNPDSQEETATFNPGWEVLGAGADVIDSASGDYRLSGDQQIDAGAGDDSVEGGVGRDHLIGGDGRDTLDGGSGDDTLSGGDYGDLLIGGSGADQITGDEGWDEIVGGTGDDSISGGWGKDTIEGGSGHDTLSGDQHDDEIYGGSGRDLIFGGTGNDFIEGGDAPDTIRGDDGQDTINGGDGGDDIDGGGQDDFIHGGLGVDQILGGYGDDTLYGDEAQDALFGQEGNDVLHGGYDADNLFGGAGDDFLSGDDGNDALNGEDGADTLEGGEGADLLDGGAQTDIATYAFASAAVGVDLERGRGITGEADGDLYVSIEGVFGSAYNDTISGDAGANQIEGRDGDDVLSGRDGQDTLYGGDGSDTADGGAGDDTVFGNGGDDRLFGGAGNDVLLGEAGDDVLLGDSGDDTLDGGIGDDVLVGGFGNDSLVGGDHSDQLSGGQGDDTLEGGNDNDLLDGDGGADVLFGGAGNDLLAGGAGQDTLTGGAGADGFITGGGQGHDRVEDFVVGQDKIALAEGAYQVVIFDDDGGARVQVGPEDSLLLVGVAASEISLSDISYSSGSSVDLLQVISGTAGAEALDGTISTDFILGLDGNDTIRSNGGDDYLYGGTGNDLLYGDAGRSMIFGEDGNDKIFAGAGAEVIDGGSGNDFVYYQNSDAAVSIDLRGNALRGGSAEGDRLVGIEKVFASNYDDTLTAGDDGSSFYARGGADLIVGGSGNDFARGEGGDDTISGGSGDDIIDGGVGADWLDGGVGNDTLSYATSNIAVSVDLETGEATGGYAEGDIFAGFENLNGSKDQTLGDRLSGDDAENRISGERGDDFIRGRGGNDSLYGGTGTDTFSFSKGDGDDIIFDFEAGTDHIEFVLEVPAYTVEDASDGALVTYDGGTVMVHDATAAEVTAALVEANRIEGGSSADVLDGTSGTDVIFGFEGNDTLSSNGGDDLLFGGDGNDRFYGSTGRAEMYGGNQPDYFYAGAGAELIDGGDHSDYLYYNASDAAVTVDLESGLGAGGYAEGDVILNIEKLSGSAYGDSLRGDAASNRLYGQNGNDTLDGSDGDDRLYGQNGNDILIGGMGDDRLQGGADADTFVFGYGHGNDTVEDFEDGVDLIRIYGASWSDLSISYDGANTTIALDESDTIVLEGVSDALLAEDDFLLQ